MNVKHSLGPLADVSNWGNLALLEQCHAQATQSANPQARFGDGKCHISREEAERAERIHKATWAWHYAQRRD